MKRKSRYIHLFFDLDRTLWDFESNSREAFQEIFVKYKLDSKISSLNLFVKTYKYYNELLWEKYRRGDIKKDFLRTKRFQDTLSHFHIFDNELACSINEDYLELSPLKRNLIPGTLEVLNYLQSKYRLHILTNGFKETQDKKMRNCGLYMYFKHVFTSETIGLNKPSPGIFAYAVNSLNAKKETCIMIGDDYEVDIMGARGYGIDQVYFNPSGKAFSRAPTYVINHLKELKNIL